MSIDVKRLPSNVSDTLLIFLPLPVPLVASAESVEEQLMLVKHKMARQTKIDTVGGGGDVDGAETGKRMATGSRARRRTTTPVPFERQRHMTYCLSAWKHRDVVGARQGAAASTLFRGHDRRDSTRQA